MTHLDYLLQFYLQYLIWAEQGAKTEEFNAQTGLCGNLHRWVKRNHPNAANLTGNLHYVQENLFSEAGLNVLYPFGGQDQYMNEKDNHAMHLNKQRLKWCGDHVMGAISL